MKTVFHLITHEEFDPIGARLAALKDLFEKAYEVTGEDEYWELLGQLDYMLYTYDRLIKSYL